MIPCIFKLRIAEDSLPGLGTGGKKMLYLIKGGFKRLDFGTTS
jgi:hypothetical protein